MATNTWVVIVRNTDLAVPSLKVLTDNLPHEKHEIAKAQADEIHQQRDEGEDG